MNGKIIQHQLRQINYIMQEIAYQESALEDIAQQLPERFSLKSANMYNEIAENLQCLSDVLSNLSNMTQKYDNPNG